MIRHDDLRAPPELGQPLLGGFGRFDLHVDGLRAVAHRQIEHRKLLFDAAVELAVILVTAAGSQDDSVGKLLQKLGNGFRALARQVQKIEAKFEKAFPGFGFTPRMVQKRRNIRQAQRDTNAGERPGLRHLVV